MTKLTKTDHDSLPRTHSFRFGFLFHWSGPFNQLKLQPNIITVPTVLEPMFRGFGYWSL